MTLREKLERAKPTVDSPTYRRLTGQITEKDYRKAIADEVRRIERGTTKHAASASDR